MNVMHKIKSSANTEVSIKNHAAAHTRVQP